MRGTILSFRLTGKGVVRRAAGATISKGAIFCPDPTCHGAAIRPVGGRSGT
jgi:hypothetical protein